MKNSRVLQLVVILCLVVVIIFMLYREFFRDSLDYNTQEVSKQEIPFDTFTTNVTGGEFNFLKMDITLLASTKKGAEFIKENKPVVRRFLLTIFTAQDGRKILVDKDKFEKTIKDKIKDEFDIDISRVYFTDFVLAD